MLSMLTDFCPPYCARDHEHGPDEDAHNFVASLPLDRCGETTVDALLDRPAQVPAPDVAWVEGGVLHVRWSQGDLEARADVTDVLPDEEHPGCQCAVTDSCGPCERELLSLHPRAAELRVLLGA